MVDTNDLHTIAIYTARAALTFSFLCCVWRFRTGDSASKIFAALISADFIFEVLALFAARRYHNNIPVYTIHSLVEFVLCCMYFGANIDVLKKSNAAWYIAAIGCIWGLIDILYLQGINKMNSYFLIVEGLVIICLALLSFFRLLLLHDSLKLYKYTHFWLTFILILFWSATFFNWSMYNFVRTQHHQHLWVIQLSILAVNTFTYTGIGVIFLLYPKMQQTYE